MDKTKNYLIGLLHELRDLPKETEWAEFKVNYSDPQEVGEYISALSNSATLNGKANAYLVWGIDNETHKMWVLPSNRSALKKAMRNWKIGSCGC